MNSPQSCACAPAGAVILVFEEAVPTENKRVGGRVDDRFYVVQDMIVGLT